MTAVDKRLNADEMQMLRALIGKKILSFRHEEFHPTHASYGAVGIETEQGMIYLFSDLEPLSAYGYVDDVAVWTLTRERRAWIDESPYAYVFASASPVNATVKEIHVVQEHQRLYENGGQTFDVRVTRGIIFDFGDYQYSLEKAVWFSQLIFIEKGNDLINTFDSTDKFVAADWNEGWDEGVTAECDREIVVIC